MTVQPQHRALFSECASPEAIRAELKKATAARDRAERIVTWLTELAAERDAQVAAGTWPPNPAGAPDA